jgi:hypothetical protein
MIKAENGKKAKSVARVSCSGKTPSSYDAEARSNRSIPRIESGVRSKATAGSMFKGSRCRGRDVFVLVIRDLRLILNWRGNFHVLRILKTSK